MNSNSKRVTTFGMVMVLLIGAGLIWAAISYYKLPHLAWLISLLLVSFVMVLWGYNVVGVWTGIFMDRRNVISLSRVQMVLWTVLIVSAILAAALWNLHMQVDALIFDIPGELWALMGISAGSSVGSALILSTKAAGNEPNADQFARQKSLSATPGSSDEDKAAEMDCVINHGTVVSNTKPEMARWSDMVTGDETGNFAHIDLSKCQMLLFTVIAVLIYGLSLWTLFQAMTVEGAFTNFPAFDKSMLALIGISHGGYLTYKMTPNSETSK